MPCVSINKKFTIWMMGPTSSGKTTLASNLLKFFRQNKIPSIHFDGDEVRDFFGPNHGFASEDRLRVVSTIGHLANKSYEAGLIVIVSALTANRDARDYINENVEGLITVFIDCSIEECASRDPKGLYKNAINGNIHTLIGFNTKYEPPNADITIKTDDKEINDCLKTLISFLEIGNHLKTGEGGMP